MNNKILFIIGCALLFLSGCENAEISNQGDGYEEQTEPEVQLQTEDDEVPSKVITSSYKKVSSREIVITYENHTETNWQPNTHFLLEKLVDEEGDVWEGIPRAEGHGFIAFNPRTFSNGIYERRIRLREEVYGILEPGLYRISHKMLNEDIEGVISPENTLTIFTTFYLE